MLLESEESCSEHPDEEKHCLCSFHGDSLVCCWCGDLFEGVEDMGYGHGQYRETKEEK